VNIKALDLFKNLPKRKKFRAGRINVGELEEEITRLPPAPRLTLPLQPKKF